MRIVTENKIFVSAFEIYTQTVMTNVILEIWQTSLLTYLELYCIIPLSNEQRR